MNLILPILHLLMPSLLHMIDLPPDGKKIGFNLVDGDYFTIPYIIDVIPNSPDGHQLPTQAQKHFWFVIING